MHFPTPFGKSALLLRPSRCGQADEAGTKADDEARLRQPVVIALLVHRQVHDAERSAGGAECDQGIATRLRASVRAGNAAEQSYADRSTRRHRLSPVGIACDFSSGESTTR